jgi:signal transduction histidine kinase
LNLSRLILGSQPIDDPQQERKILLGAYLIFLYLVVDLLLFFVNLVDPLGIPWVLVSGVIVSIISLMLLRKGRTNLAIFLYLFRANTIVFYFSSQEDISTGTFIYFLSYGITPLAFYGYLERWIGILYSIVTFLLFLIANFQLDEFRPDHPHFNFIINYAVVLVTLSVIVLAFDRINGNALRKIKRQNDELTKANEELDRFVYSVSHDLRSPLTSILGLVNVYQISPNEEERARIIRLIKERTLKLDDFIRKILDYSRNSRGQLKLEPIELRQQVSAVLDSLAYMPHFDNIKFDIDIPAEFRVVSDEERLKIILANLVSNAIKYIDKGKEVPIVRIKAETNGRMLLIVVEDNGIGIMPDRINRIFEMFYRASEASDGSGIGLYIARECADNLNGEIQVESQYCKGTRFTVKIPQP